MIAELLCVLFGHDSSLFTPDSQVSAELLPLLHPGEVDTLESLSRLAQKANRIRAAIKVLRASNVPPDARSRNGSKTNAPAPSEYLAALGSALATVLNEYETLVVETETRVLRGDDELVGAGSVVALSSIRAVFSPWDTPFTTLDALIQHLYAGPNTQSPHPAPTPTGDLPHWPPGPLIDLLLQKAQTGVYKISDIMTHLAFSVEKVWRLHLASFLIHGTLSLQDPLAILSTSPPKGSGSVSTFSPLILNDSAIPSCISSETRDSILYIGKAVATVKSQSQSQKQIPRFMTLEHAKMIESVLPQDGYAFDRVIGEIRTEISEFLWTHVLLDRDVENAIDSLANYFLLRNGEFGVCLIREIERLKVSRLTSRTASSKTALIREQDLSLALLRASLGTSAEHDSTLSRLRFSLPSGPLRPLLPNISAGNRSMSVNSPNTDFSSFLLGTPLLLNYHLTWPLDLFLIPSDLQIYSVLFSYFSSIKRAQQLTYECWVGLSNAQRNRRRWTGQNEGGTGDEVDRQNLLRCGWGVIRLLLWFLDTFWGYLMTDVVGGQYERFRKVLWQEPQTHLAFRRDSQGEGQILGAEFARPQTPSEPGTARPQSAASTHRTATTTGHPARNSASSHLDFTTLRALHSNYLNGLVTGSLLSNSTCASLIRSVLEVCETFVAQVERWGGDILPALLFEGSINGRDNDRNIVKERWGIVKEINDELEHLLTSFYEHLSQSSTSPLVDPSSTMMHHPATLQNITINASMRTTLANGARASEGESQVRKNIEHLLLRLDFNMGFSRAKTKAKGNDVAAGILKQGGLV